MRQRPIAERFEEKFVPEPNTGCWLWTAGTNACGYGKLGKYRSSGSLLAHRISWELHRGLIPEGLCVLHRCDTPACVNPDHLFLGTQVENIADRHMKKRDQMGERHSSAKLKPNDVVAIRRRSSTGERGARLAREFGLAASSVYAILKGVNWAHLKEAP